MRAEQGVTITALEVENLKRVRAVTLKPEPAGLTVIGGRNGQGKTSVLDAIVWALGGDRYKPSRPVHDGADQAAIRLELSNGITVERRGSTAALKVSGKSGGQTLLNEFVNELALNLPKFMASGAADKARMLLDCFPGLGKRLQDLNERIRALYADRLAVGRIADQKEKHAADLPFHEDAPETPLTGAEMSARMEEALRLNARNREMRAQAEQADERLATAAARLRDAQGRVTDAEARLRELKREAELRQADLASAKGAAEAAKASAADLKDADTAAVQAELERIDEINAKVRTNATKSDAKDTARRMRLDYNSKTDEVEAARAERLKLLSTVQMPLDGLSVDEEGELLYGGQKWDCMSASEQLRVAAAICAAVKPACRFVLLDRLEAMDRETLGQFSSWLAERGLQCIGTRVSVGDECSIVIEDGVVADEHHTVTF